MSMGIIVGGDQGEWPKGTRIEKVNSEPGDTHKDGAEGTIVGALGPAPLDLRAEMLAKGEIKQDAIFIYWVVWDDLPGIPVAVVDYRIKPKESADKNTEVREVKLKNNQFLLHLTDKGMVYQGYDPETIIKVAACEGHFNDWAAYFETPETPFHDVVHFGNKLPEDTAKELFPEWEKKGLRWRA